VSAGGILTWELAINRRAVPPYRREPGGTFSTDSSARFSNSRTSQEKFSLRRERHAARTAFQKSTPISSSKSCTDGLSRLAYSQLRRRLLKFKLHLLPRKYRKCRSFHLQVHYAQKLAAHQHGISSRSNRRGISSMTELLEGTSEVRPNQGRPDSKKQDQKMQIGVEFRCAIR